MLPITLFILVYIHLAMRRYFGLRVLWALAAVAGFVVLSAVLGRALPAGALNGSLGYMPAFLALVGVGLVLLARGARGGDALLSAAAIFLVSLTARTADDAVCSALPIGLHYVWHVLNAVVLYLLVRALLRYGRRHA